MPKLLKWNTPRWSLWLGLYVGVKATKMFWQPLWIFIFEQVLTILLYFKRLVVGVALHLHKDQPLSEHRLVWQREAHVHNPCGEGAKYTHKRELRQGIRALDKSVHRRMFSSDLIWNNHSFFGMFRFMFWKCSTSIKLFHASSIRMCHLRGKTSVENVTHHSILIWGFSTVPF